MGQSSVTPRFSISARLSHRKREGPRMRPRVSTVWRTLSEVERKEVRPALWTLKSTVHWASDTERSCVHATEAKKDSSGMGRRGVRTEPREEQRKQRNRGFRGAEGGRLHSASLVFSSESKQTVSCVCMHLSVVVLGAERGTRVSFGHPAVGEARDRTPSVQGPWNASVGEGRARSR